MFARIYRQIADLRNRLYEKGALRSFSLGAPAISVGNITAGGTGKTPLVVFVAEVLAEKGEQVCVLTRGYGRENPKTRVLVSDGRQISADVRTAGDEPLEMARKLLGKALILADADRVAAAGWAREKFGATAFVLDDAFQHRRARRDLDVVCIDATNPFGGSRIFLREPLKNLRRADLFVVTRANLVDRETLARLKSKISKFNPRGPVFTAENKISELIGLAEFNSDEQKNETANDRRPPIADRCLAFCALGNPHNFFEQLRRDKFLVAATQKFPDHHFYTAKDARSLEEKAAAARARFLLTTAKDAVKLKGLSFDLPVFVAESRLIFDDEKKLREMIRAVSNPKSTI